jgi:uncharacterized protein YbaP (TraB family)
MNRKVTFLACAVLFPALSLQAQLLWKISGNGLEKPSFLFGTHHLIEKSQISKIDSVFFVCSQADVLVGEIDNTDPYYQTKVMKGSLMNGLNISNLVSPADYAMLDTEFMGVMGSGMDKMGQMKPMMLDALYTVFLYMKVYKIDHQPESIDETFEKYAKAHGKAIVPLENIEDQIVAFLNTIPLKRQAQILVGDVKNMQKNLDQLKQLNALYLSGDLDKMYEMYKKDNTMTPEELKPILEDRTAKWMKQLPVMMKTQSCFITVGLLHLAGDAGLIAQLRKAGFSVEPVML